MLGRIHVAYVEPPYCISRFSLLLTFTISFALHTGPSAIDQHTKRGKVSAQPHTIVKQICFPNGNVLFSSLFTLIKN